MSARRVKDETPSRVWTIGHSTRSAEELGELLNSNRIQTLVDVRSFPGSRRFPQFNHKRLAEYLDSLGIDYKHLPSLGGRRKPKVDSKNTAWQNAAFRAYADYMETEEFEKGIAELLKLAQEKPTAIMCAEAVWWKCHRSLIADYLKSKGVEVMHVLSANKTELHPFTAAARIVRGKLSYKGLLEG